ncbi:DinB family protein [Streptomyces sp. NBC_01387]|uniref:DinB family protein n=1 Tax=unclassified Streptomyces TaxID=2593676 RepID=UPI0022595F40|nr:MULTISPECIES: DinB family protein [unclassified Streptomyces]MCX4554360.1 DinB family protein [Streptomyces sp. NBC_01500]WSC25067.1 DinB family protein [Streptomyces sp. NBC_01766]
MTEITAEAWPEPPLAGTEAAAVIGALERQRATLAWKCSGLDATGMQATVGASTITLGGLLKHLAHVEDSHFARLWLGSSVGAPWNTVDWDTFPDWDYHSAAKDTPEQLLTLWQESVARSRAIVDKALSAGGLDQVGAYVTRSGEHPNLRRILLDLVEEYARHVGHADLIRESVDGLAGEDPPR